MSSQLIGQRHVIEIEDAGYPNALLDCKSPPSRLYVIGNPQVLESGIAIVGARKATPYGLSHSEHFAQLAAKRGIAVISGGALGCDSAAHRGALSVGGKTVAVLGGGCDRLYPARNKRLFQEIIDNDGAVISENSWDEEPFGWRFRTRNRIIAGLAEATLIIEAGLPSGTFSTADEALAAGREVLSLPGAITSKQSHGSNQLIFQGAIPIIDDDSFHSMIDMLFAHAPKEMTLEECARMSEEESSYLLQALQAQPLSVDEIRATISMDPLKPATIADAMVAICALEAQGRIAKYPDGKYGPTRTIRDVRKSNISS